MDSTLDITKKDQLSVVLRYVVIDYHKKSIEIKESFLGFFELKNMVLLTMKICCIVFWNLMI